jgi:predicted alpha/beta hydrolase family esterase
LLPGAGHLNVEAGYGAWPAMEAWALGQTDALTPREDPVGA